MAALHEFMIRVHGEWNGWRSADIPLTSLENIHWYQAPGAPRSLIHAFVRCTESLCALVQHACDHSQPHLLHICVLKRHAISSVYEDLVHRADQALSGGGLHEALVRGSA